MEASADTGGEVREREGCMILAVMSIEENI